MPHHLVSGSEAADGFGPYTHGPLPVPMLSCPLGPLTRVWRGEGHAARAWPSARSVYARAI
jgi:hypothetical protein